MGTSGFKPLRLLGGAFGWGLSRNVRDLYESLCRHYETGDQVCVFGFSRGAYTARVLAHFIITCGILDRRKAPPGAKWFRWPGQPTTMSAEAGFKLGIRTAYKSYRRRYWENAGIFLQIFAKMFRWLRNGLYVDVPLPGEFRKLYSLTKSEDTIENYGP